MKTIAIAIAILVTACTDDRASVECGPRPAPTPIFAKEVNGHVEIDIQQWLDHEAWISYLIDWSICMGYE